MDWTEIRGEDVGHKLSQDRAMAHVLGFKRVLGGSIITIKILILKNSKIFPFSPDFPLISKKLFFLYRRYNKKYPGESQKVRRGIFNNVFKSKGEKSKKRHFNPGA